MMNWKELGRNRSWPNFKVLAQHSPGRKTTRNLSQDSRSPGQDLNPGPPEYEARDLTTRPRSSVQNLESGRQEYNISRYKLSYHAHATDPAAFTRC
jgi:hypothetical protein